MPMCAILRNATIRSQALATLAFLVVLLAEPVIGKDLTMAMSRGPVSLLVYVAEDRGFFDEEGISVRTRDCASGRACFQMLADGTVDVATAAELLVTLNSFKRSDLAIIGTLSTSSHQIKLIARRSAGIQEAAHLRGKRIATVVGTSAHYFLDSFLVFHAVDPKSTSVVPLPPDQLVGALQRREVDAIIIWEPLASAAVTALAGDALALPSPRIYTQHFSLITNRRTIGIREAELVRMLRALLRAQQFIANDPSSANAVLRSRLDVGPGLSDTYMKEHDFRIRLDQSLVTTMESERRWAVREGQVGVGAPGNQLQFIEPSLLRKAATGAVSLPR